MRNICGRDEFRVSFIFQATSTPRSIWSRQALQALGEQESGTARLEGAIAAYSEALLERTSARLPLQRAKSTGYQGVALSLLAERHRFQAKLAIQQIEAAFTTMCDGGDAPNAAYFEAQLPKARALVQKLAKP